jgi:hypothetical protein
MVKSKHARAGVSCGMLLMAACNARLVDPIGGGPGQAGQGAESEAGNGGKGWPNSAGAGRDGAPSGSAGQAGAGDGCATIPVEVGAQIENQQTCSVLVLLTSIGLQVEGHALICGPRNVLDEAGARASDAAESRLQTGLIIDSGELLSGPAPNDIWLFRQIIGDAGHVSAVSAASGQTLFWAEFFLFDDGSEPTLAGTRIGTPLTPPGWATTEIGRGCSPAPPPLAGWGRDLRVDPRVEPAIAPEEQALEVVLTSALVAGVAAKMPLTSTVSVHYGVSAIADVPPLSEYIVIVNAAQAP